MADVKAKGRLVIGDHHDARQNRKPAHQERDDQHPRSERAARVCAIAMSAADPRLHINIVIRQIRWIQEKRHLSAVTRRTVALQPLPIPDLLMHYLLNVAPGSETAARRHVDLELETLIPGPVS
jgi:hypothetical protein